MKHLLLIFAAVVLVGCGGETDYSGNYWLEEDNGVIHTFNFKKDGTFYWTRGDSGKTNNASWLIENEMLVLEYGKAAVDGGARVYYNKDTLKYIHTIDGGQTYKKYDSSQLHRGVFKEEISEPEPFVTKCRVCKGKVSSQAKVCPHCGQPDPL